MKDTRTFIGSDKFGNKYFESVRPNNPNPYRRFYEAPKYDERHGLAANFMKVPPPWDAWLRYRRETPPTDEEVQEQEQYQIFQQTLALERKSEAKTAALEAQKDPAVTVEFNGSETASEPVTEKTGTFPKLPFER